MRLTNGFQGLTAGTTLTGGVGGNSGGTSGDFFDAITGPVTASNAAAAHETMGVSCAAAAGEAYAEWFAQIVGTFGTFYSRAYLRNMTAPPANCKLISLFAASVVAGRLNIDSTGHIALTDTAGTTIGAASTTVVTGRAAPVRIEFKVIADPTVGVLECRIFLTGDAVSPDEVMTRTAVNTGTAGAMNKVRFGPTGTAITATMLLDDVGITDVDYMGPVGAGLYRPPPVFAPLRRPVRLRFVPMRQGVSTDTQISASDTGTGADDAALATDLAATDVGTGGDTADLVALDAAAVAKRRPPPMVRVPGFLRFAPSPKQGVGDTIAAADTGTGTDTATLAADLAATDIGAGTDTATLAVDIPTAADIGTGVDTASVLVVGDATATFRRPPPMLRAPGMLRFAPRPAQGVSSDAVQINAADTGTGADTATLATAIPASDTGTDSETATLAVTVSAADTGTGTDTATLATALTGTDTGTGADTATLAAALAGSDTATAADLATLATAIATADLAAAVDTATVDMGVVAYAPSFRRPPPMLRGPTFLRFAPRPAQGVAAPVVTGGIAAVRIIPGPTASPRTASGPEADLRPLDGPTARLRQLTGPTAKGT
jgi:hypothetical protein